jgi:undecaprenyl-diphosphatase
MFFTALGLWPVLLPTTAVVLAAAYRWTRNLTIALVWAGSQMLSQLLVVLVKPAFHRERPPDALGYALTDFSYPSGHAVTAVVYYVMLALIISGMLLIPRMVRVSLCFLAIVAASGICWSRLALGAHYATDVIGGVLFGTGWLCALAALLLRLRASEMKPANDADLPAFIKS